MEKVNKGGIYLKGWCPICDRVVMFISCWSPIGKWVCTHCEYRTKKMFERRNDYERRNKQKEIERKE